MENERLNKLKTRYRELNARCSEVAQELFDIETELELLKREIEQASEQSAETWIAYNLYPSSARPSELK